MESNFKCRLRPSSWNIFIFLGLIVGVSSSLILTFVRATVPSIRVLEKGEDGVWLNKKYFKTEGGIKVIQLMGPVNFLVKDLVR